MALFTWKDDYSVNIGAIDQQHKKLVDMMNALHEAMIARQARQILDKILQELADYTVSHFANEENLMKTHGYPDYESHHDKHQKMTAKVLALQDELKQGKISLSLEVMDFLKNWLSKHIMGTDKKYSAFLNSKGIH